MVGDGEGGHLALAEALHFHVIFVALADGDGGVDDVGDQHHALADFLVQLLLQHFQLGQTVGVGLDLGLDFFGLSQLGGVLLGLAHQHANLLGELVALGAEVIGLHDGGAALGIQLDDLVHHGQLLVLELLADVFLYDLGILPDKTNVKHDFFSLTYIIIDANTQNWDGGRMGASAPTVYHIRNTAGRGRCPHRPIPSRVDGCFT